MPTAQRKSLRRIKLQRKVRVWIFLIRKGGSAKTLTAVNFAAALAYLFGRKVLLVDLDPQGNSTSHLGIKTGKLQYTVNSLFTQIGLDPHQAIQKTSFTINRQVVELDIIPAARDLDDTDLSMKATQVGMFRPVIDTLSADYDDIIIDTRPARSYLTISAMVAATHAVIPMEAGVFALDALTDTLSDISQVQNGLNPALKLVGILPTRVREATNLSRNVLGEAAETHDDKLIRYQDGAGAGTAAEKLLFIRDSTVIAEAPAYGVPGIAYKPRENEAARDYLKMAEVLHAQET